MTTARDIIAGAYRRLGLLPLGADLDPDRAVAGLAAYNDMLNGWTANGISPAAPPPPAFGLNDAFPFAPQFEEGAKALLAVELASASGIEPSASTQKRAEKAYASLLAAYVAAPDAGQDPGLARMPSLRRYGFS